MKAKRAKQYRKLMDQFSQTFGFRAPYQVIVDAEFFREAQNIPMTFQDALERILQGKVKPMITQCSMRHLYAAKSEPGMHNIINLAKDIERRRCGHHPDEYPDPLPAEECIHSVVDPKNLGTNKHCYVVASQSHELRKAMRGIRGVPLVYVRRAVMVMEPMADESAQVRELEEKRKFRAGLKQRAGEKRKRGEEDEDEDALAGKTERIASNGEGSGEKKQKKKKRKPHGPKQPNPLSVMKRKPTKTENGQQGREKTAAGAAVESREEEAPAKKKRKRAPKKRKEAGEKEAESSGPVGPSHASAETP